MGAVAMRRLIRTLNYCSFAAMGAHCRVALGTELMPGRFSTCGPKYLARKNELAGARAKIHELSAFLLVDTGNLDAERLTATLRVLIGYKAQIRTVSTLSDAVDCIETEIPSAVFIDDLPEIGSDTREAIPLLRKSNFLGPIIVVSEKIAPPRRAALMKLGASEVVHRDDLDSVSVAEVLTSAQKMKSDAG